MARWQRAASYLGLPAGSRVLDLGCAFGFGTQFLVGRYETYGHDLSAAHIRRARRRLPGVTFTVGPANDVPYPDKHFDAVVLLDVLEHVPDERAVTMEIARVLRPGGTLILSVPNRGVFGRLDSLNTYRQIFGPCGPYPTDDPSWPVSPHHRHYSDAAILPVLEPMFQVEHVEYTGLGLAEAINLLLLITFRRLVPLPRVYAALQYLYFGAYLAEDILPAGDWGYHMLLKARRRS